MKIVVITSGELKQELLAQGLRDTDQVEWQSEISGVPGADGYIDLLFNHSAERIDKLKNLPAGPDGDPAMVLVNAVNNVLSELPPGFIRINGWAGFLKRSLVEAAGRDTKKAKAERILSCFNKTVDWVADIPGFITPRVISMIINEAFFTLDEKVSTKEEIDTAMKLGTNYPYGPFEWSKLIGLKNITALLTRLAPLNSRYTPCSLLQKEALT